MFNVFASSVVDRGFEWASTIMI